MTWYVASPLSVPLLCWGAAAWQLHIGVTDWFSLGLAVGVGFCGVVQSAYRWILQMRDERA